MNMVLIGSSLAAILFLLGAFFWFERTRPNVSSVLLIATLCAVSSVGRVIFNFIPQVQPVTAIVIIAGLSLGCRSGFMVGAMSALVSNMVLGQGPWTPWQMLAWGLIGILSGLLGRTKKQNLLFLCLFAFFFGLLFSVLMDVYTIASIGSQLTWQMALTTIGTGLLFNLSHSIGNVIFLLLLYSPMTKKLRRIQNKYQTEIGFAG